MKMTNSTRSILFACAAAAVFGIPLAAAQVTRITLFDGGDFQGRTHIMNFVANGECQNVPDFFNNAASSVNTHGACFRLWDLENCTGDTHRVQPDSPAHNNLGDERVRFNDRTTSVRSCQPWES